MVYKLNNRIRYFRKLKKLSQTQLANLCGTTRNTISSIETNVYGCSVKLALLIAFNLGVNVEDLFYFSE